MLRIGMAFVLCAVAGAIGCGSSSPSGGGANAKGDSLVGTWEAREPEMKGLALVITFTADGKFTRETVMEGLPKDANVKVDGGKQQGTYKQDGKTITLTADGKDRAMTVKELAGAKLVLANPEGKELTFMKK